MTKEYITPSIKVREIETESLLAAESLGGTTGLDNQPGIGGNNEGGNRTVGSKFNPWTSWGTDEEEN